MSETYRPAAAEAFARLGRIKLGETDLDGVLLTIAELAKATRYPLTAPGKLNRFKRFSDRPRGPGADCCHADRNHRRR